MNWKKLIAEVGATGLSQPQIAAMCGCGQATISDLVNGKTSDPRHSLGEALRALRARVCAEAATPTTPEPAATEGA